MKRFLLEKWYLDITNEEGQVFIGYAAKVKWGNTSLGYNGYLSKGLDQQISSKSSFGNFYEPKYENIDLRWRTDFGDGAWGLEGTPIIEDLLETEKGGIVWSCLLQKSMATFKLREATITGLGYVEKIQLTLPPWQFPIDQLLWGRYVSQSNGIVWIEWRGSIPKKLIYFNGEPQLVSMIGDTVIHFAEYQLIFESSFNLRSGSIGNTVFSAFKNIMAMFPARVFRLTEKKFAGSATLKYKGEQVDRGSYIHEIVDWK
ncbi:MAG: hypothetical protein JSU09_10040 [Bacteroidetes bacterium]|nr:hypothetical protein [Bacteroidota bacterium]